MLEFLKTIDENPLNLNKCLYYKAEINKWMGETLNEEKDLVRLKGELAKLHHELGFVVTHSLISALDHDVPKIRNLAMWGLGFLRDPKSIKYLRRIIISRSVKKETRAAAVTVLLEVGENVDIVTRNLGESPLCKDILCNFICLLDEPMARDQVVDVFLNFPQTVQMCILRAIEKYYNKASGMFLFEVYNNNMSLTHEVNQLVKKLLYKAGMEINVEEKMNRKSLLTQFYKAWASCTREEGSLSLFIGWSMPDGLIKVMYCVLDYFNEGISEFSVFDDMTEKELNSELIEFLGDEEGTSMDEPGFIELNCEEVLCLLGDANKIDSSLESLAISGYERYLWLFQLETDLTSENVDALMYKLMHDSTNPRTVITAFYTALANPDYFLLYSILSEGYERYNKASRDGFVRKGNRNFLKHKGLYYGFKILDLYQSKEEIFVNCEAVVDVDGIYMCKKERLHLVVDNKMWKIQAHDEVSSYPLEEGISESLLDNGDKVKESLLPMFNPKVVDAIGISYEPDDDYSSK